MLQRVAVAITAILLVLAGVSLYLQLEERSSPTEELPVNQQLGGTLELTSHEGEDFSTDSLHGNVVLKFFGFTNCPDYCPATMAKLAGAYEVLEESGEADQVDVVFVTFDPERDTPEHLADYLNWFHEDFIGLTGTPEQIENAAEKYGVVYMRQGPDDAQDYDFAHTDYVYLLDDQGRIRKLFPANPDIEEVIDDVRSLL